MVTKKSPSVVMAFDDKKYQAEDDLRTLTRAKEIEADRQRMAAVKKVGAQKIKEMQSVVVKKPVTARRK